MFFEALGLAVRDRPYIDMALDIVNMRLIFISIVVTLSAPLTAYLFRSVQCYLNGR